MISLGYSPYREQALQVSYLRTPTLSGSTETHRQQAVTISLQVSVSVLKDTRLSSGLLIIPLHLTLKLTPTSARRAWAGGAPSWAARAAKQKRTARR